MIGRARSRVTDEVDECPLSRSLDGPGRCGAPHKGLSGYCEAHAVTAEKVTATNGDAARACSILLADVHPLFRSGMRYMLQEALAPAEVVEAGSREETLAHLERGVFDLVLTSLFSAQGDWDEFLASLLERAPAGRLMLLSSIDEPRRICRVLAAGAAGFVLKETPPNIILHAIRLVLDGGIYVPPVVLRALSRDGTVETLAASEVPPAGVGTSLTERQQAVLCLIVQGASNKAIARSLDLSVGTVKGHVANLLRLYGAESRLELVHAVTKRRSLPAAKPEGSEARRSG
ncbi:LuxR C-terminal-related transcriptional regulator [Sabulicella glaciei]|uniref:Response regulator transcription factor n=1 Tax=Sabulicella glaciei TaxID=2984948 RepID=A0ABT3P1L9_9PROT|nr:response regulator transcription factor [Roseococcus sp. MDT2-1-1]MCW8088302.1 response regulator transcription factor [Roseococcus sp. MDT2-1-1]